MALSYLFCVMLLVYSEIKSPRLDYIADLIFGQLLGIEASLTNQLSEFISYSGPRLCYGKENKTTGAFFLQSHELLFETSICRQEINWFKDKDCHAFFRTPTSDFPFDMLAASFYLVSRYEEYLPFVPDSYGRFPHESSQVFKETLLNQPLVNSWALALGEKLIQFFPEISIRPGSFRFIPTYDIDIAYSYLNKGLLRNIAGFLKNPSLERIRVCLTKKNDPFDCYAWLDALHSRYQLSPLYFFLLAKKNKEYDKNILPARKAMRKLIEKHAKQYTIGIHPSWQSNFKKHCLQEELQTLSSITQQPIKNSRQHYIKFQLPDTYRSLIEAGIENDFSMGYGSINGFRASIASSFLWYDLKNETATSLRVHPFCFMDANSFYEQRLSARQTSEELSYYLRICKSVHGQLITIWHNNFLGTDPSFNAWREVYEDFIKTVSLQ